MGWAYGKVCLFFEIGDYGKAGFFCVRVEVRVSFEMCIFIYYEVNIYCVY